MCVCVCVCVCKGVILPNDCSGYDIKQSERGPGNLGNMEYTFITFASRSTAAAEYADCISVEV